MKPHRWLIWFCFVVGWTVLLLFPDPDAFIQPTTPLPPGRRWLMAKSAHLIGYVMFAVLSGWLRVPQRFRPLLMFFLLAHSNATELGQTFLSRRDGNLVDVAIDNVGILIGFALSWHWWAKKDPV